MLMLILGVILLYLTAPTVLSDGDEQRLFVPVELFVLSLANVVTGGWLTFARLKRKQSANVAKKQ